MNVFHMLEHLQQHVSRFYPAVCSHCSSLHDGADVDAAVSPVVALTNNTDSQKVVLLCQGEQTSTWQTSQQSHVQQAGKQSSTYPCWVWRWWCWGSWWSRWCCWRTTTGKAGEWNILYTHTIHTVNLNSRRGSGVSVSVLRDLSWPLCAGVVCACVAASGEKKSFVLWSCWAWNVTRRTE